ncbi:hypothetical protein FIU89_18895 [Roseovarius sp. THAF27]|uniref:DUF4145 domain-containing protein n=1 Tax=Roseovarius sp. THAF27 TaxID=2587850 RepID=UPI0012682EFA|nr:DUF4145 domain-containing protein [Roseovarius sp. THAF27]QFT82703.1 hypothetical protein FIU89_18895 [Roseovarius sp. THAF27]
MEYSVKRSLLHDKQTIKADCPECKRSQNCLVETGLLEITYEGPVDASDKHLILRCLGCDTVFYGHLHSFSEEVDFDYDEHTGEWRTFNPVHRKFFPKTNKRQRANWHNTSFEIAYPDLSDLLDSLLEIFNGGHNSFVAMGVRTGFDLVAEVLKIEEDLPFSDKIEALRSRGFISPREKSVLDNLVDAGSAAIHRDWKPTDEEADLLIETLEQFINRAVVLPQGLDNLVKKVPKKTVSKGK